MQNDISDPNYLPSPFELFGIECGKGWEKLYGPVIEKINKYNEEHLDDPIRVEQVKEKWGTLRIYVSSAPKEIYDLIEEAERKSRYVCEDCGFQDNEKVKTRNIMGWYRTLCEKCFNSCINERKV